MNVGALIQTRCQESLIESIYKLLNMNKYNNLATIILAAGKGTRMKSETPKVLHKICNKEMLLIVTDIAKELGSAKNVVVVSEEMLSFNNIHNKDYQLVIQKERLGTGHAVLCGLDNMKDFSGNIVILYGDTPLVKQERLQEMLNILNTTDSGLVLLGFYSKDNKNRYGKLVTSGNKVERIVEYKDASNEERSIALCNSGVIAVKSGILNNLIHKIGNNNASSEYYLTDIISIANDHKIDCVYIECEEEEVLGINSKAELAVAEKIMQQRLREKHLQGGVTLIDPESIYFSMDTIVEADTIIYPNVYFGNGVNISSNTEIRSFSHIEGVRIESNVVVGPFARIRQGTVLEEESRIGNFVEVKNSQISKGTKINHLSYIGDSDIGQKTNIGAGTIICNYDGFEKHKATIGNNVFIGSNNTIISPLTIDDEAITAAGSVITKDVEKGSLAVSRSSQKNLPNKAVEYRKRKSMQ